MVDEDVPFAVIPAPVRLAGTEIDLAELLEAVQRTTARFTPPLRLIFVDTLSRTMAGGDENAPSDMTTFIQNIDWLRAATRAHVCVIHHTGKDRSKGARGHSSLRAAVDTEIEVQKEPSGGTSIARVTKQRDLPTDDEFGFTLEPFVLGTDTRGNPVSSCVVIPTETPPTGNAGRARPWPPSEREAYNLLKEAIANEGGTVEIRPGELKMVVAESTWRKYCLRGLITLSNNPDSARRAFNRAARGLRLKHAVDVLDGNVWITNPNSGTKPDMSGPTAQQPF